MRSAATELCFLKRTAQRLVTMNDGVFVGQWSPKYSRHQLVDMFDVLQPRVTIAAMLCPAERLCWLRDWIIEGYTLVSSIMEALFQIKLVFGS